jgi:hypothetical protein
MNSRKRESEPREVPATDQAIRAAGPLPGGNGSGMP